MTFQHKLFVLFFADCSHMIQVRYTSKRPSEFSRCGVFSTHICSQPKQCKVSYLVRKCAKRADTSPPDSGSSHSLLCHILKAQPMTASNIDSIKLPYYIKSRSSQEITAYLSSIYIITQHFPTDRLSSDVPNLERDRSVLYNSIASSNKKIEF